jgi:hypothetical protein
MEKVTKFWYKNFPDEDYFIYDCPTYPLQTEYEKNSINTQFQDGYITSRPRISRNFAKYSLNFIAVEEESKLHFQELERLVNISDKFQWLPNIGLEPTDYDSNGDLLPENERTRSVRLIDPVQYQLTSFGRYDFTITLQEAI